MPPSQKRPRKDAANPKDKFLKMRADDRMLAILEENSRITGNTKSDEVRIALEERNRRLKRK